MSTISSFSSFTTMLQTTNIVCQNVNLTDELKIGLEYDVHSGLLNISVKNTGNDMQLPSEIHILTSKDEDSQFICDDDDDEYLPRLSELQQDARDQITDLSYGDEDEPKICIELSTIYVYDLIEEDENDLCQTIITSPALFFCSSSLSSSASSYFDDHTSDNDDGYSTHSLDDIEQQSALSIPSAKRIVPYRPHHSDDHFSTIGRLIAQVMWLSPFKKTVKRMLINHLF